MMEAIVLLFLFVFILLYVISIQQKEMDKLVKYIVYYRTQSDKWEYLYKNFHDVDEGLKDEQHN